MDLEEMRGITSGIKTMSCHMYVYAARAHLNATERLQQTDLTLSLYLIVIGVHIYTLNRLIHYYSWQYSSWYAV